MTISQVIIQAGGRGTRLETLTRNRPKCLVPVDGKPLLYHTFDAFPGASFTIIVDYRSEVVRRYLDAFPPGVPVRIVEADGDGTCGGIAKAAAGLEQDVPVAVVWCDLLFGGPPDIAGDIHPTMGTTTDFPCRFTLAPSQGVFGLFWFPQAAFLSRVPKDGEFSEWMMQTAPRMRMVTTCDVPGVREYGTAQALRDHWDAKPASRWFNSVEMGEKTVIKRAKTAAARQLLNDEAEWYAETDRRGFGMRLAFGQYLDGVITLDRLSGGHPDEISPTADHLHAIMDTLASLHALDVAPVNRLAVREMYVDKPLARLAHIPKLAPDFAARETIEINGRTCPNPLARPYLLTDLLDRLMPPRFVFIHGDPTFSNIIMHRSGPCLIDPRGRFGGVQFYGDPAYDWAKLWYSLVGGYDQFNRKRFVLTLDFPVVEIEIAPSGWEHLAPVMAERLGPDMMRRVHLLHGLIWLSLSGYVTDCYDSMLAAWFKGMLELEGATA